MADVDESCGNKAKTPISYLQELCMKKGVTPQYDLVANEGAVHEPLFVFKVIAGDVIGSGKGPSKKKAKHNAAISALNQMIDCSNLISATLSTPSNDSSLNSSLMVDLIENSSGNPVGELQELTQKRMWPPPVYDHTSEQGPPHDRDFVCTVHLYNHKEQAVGKSKKLAKRNVAIIMLQKIKQGVIVPVDKPGKVDTIADTLSKIHLKSGMDNKENIQSLTNSSPIKEQLEKKKSSMFSKSKNSRYGKFLESLQKIDFDATHSNTNFGELRSVKLLDELAKEQDFQANYFLIQTKGGREKCTVELTTIPPCVMHGIGSNSDLAKENAARNALRILKILTMN